MFGGDKTGISQLFVKHCKQTDHHPTMQRHLEKVEAIEVLDCIIFELGCDCYVSFSSHMGEFAPFGGIFLKQVQQQLNSSTTTVLYFFSALSIFSVPIHYGKIFQCSRSTFQGKQF